MLFMGGKLQLTLGKWFFDNICKKFTKSFCMGSCMFYGALYLKFDGFFVIRDMKREKFCGK